MFLLIGSSLFLSKVLVKVHAIGINPVETYIRAGAFPGPTAKPHILGSDAAGEIEGVGEDVKKFKVICIITCFHSSFSRY